MNKLWEYIKPHKNYSNVILIILFFYPIIHSVVIAFFPSTEVISIVTYIYYLLIIGSLVDRIKLEDRIKKMEEEIKTFEK